MNRRSFCLTLVLVAAIAGAVLVRHYHATARRLSAWNQQQDDQALYTALTKPIELRPGNQTLADFAVSFAEQTHTVVVIDDEVVDPFDSSTKFSPKATHIEVPSYKLPASSHLSLAARQLDLCWFIR